MFQITTAQPVDPAVRIVRTLDGRDSIWTDVERIDGRLFSYAFLFAPETQQSAFLRVEVASGPWHDRLRASSTGANAPDVILSAAIPADGAAVFVISDTLGGQDCRVIATDKSGQPHTAILRGHRDADRSRLAQITATFSGLKSSDLKEVLYQSRPFTHFIEFTNLSLDRDTVTKPTHRTGQCDPDIIPADNPGPGEFFVSGNVPRPGVYSMTGRQTTVKQAVAAAGINSAALDGYRLQLIRRQPDNQERFISIDLDALFKGAQPDYYLQPNDLLQIAPPKPPATSPAPNPTP